MASPIIRSPDEIRAQVAPLITFATTIRRETASILVQDEKTHADACEVLQYVKGQWEEIDRTRQSITGPILTAKKNADAFFQPALKALAECEMRLKQEIARYRATIAQARVAQAEQNLPVMSPPATVEGAKDRIVERWRVVNADAVPRAFCSPDEGLINAFLRDGGLRAIPGIEFYEETMIVANKGLR